jgi:hypothetical protein
MACESRDARNVRALRYVNITKTDPFVDLVVAVNFVSLMASARIVVRSVRALRYVNITETEPFVDLVMAVLCVALMAGARIDVRSVRALQYANITLSNTTVYNVEDPRHVSIKGESTDARSVEVPSYASI